MALAGATLPFLNETNETNETAGVTFHLRTVLNCFELLRRNYAQESLPDRGSGGWSEWKILPPLWVSTSVLGSRRAKLFPLHSSMNEIRWMPGRVGTNVSTEFLRRNPVLTLGLHLGRPLLHE